jgi:hypothetical protein
MHSRFCRAIRVELILAAAGCGSSPANPNAATTTSGTTGTVAGSAGAGGGTAATGDSGATGGSGSTDTSGASGTTGMPGASGAVDTGATGTSDVPIDAAVDVSASPVADAMAMGDHAVPADANSCAPLVPCDAATCVETWRSLTSAYCGGYSDGTLTVGCDGYNEYSFNGGDTAMVVYFDPQTNAEIGSVSSSGVGPEVSCAGAPPQGGCSHGSPYGCPSDAGNDGAAK